MALRGIALDVTVEEVKETTGCNLDHPARGPLLSDWRSRFRKKQYGPTEAIC
jgi:hypothetical protein